MADIHYRAELCPDRGELLHRFITRHHQLLRTVDGGLPGELAAVQRGIAWLREQAAADTKRRRTDDTGT